MHKFNSQLHVGDEAGQLKDFTDMLLNIGDGTFPTVPDMPPHTIRLPDELVAPTEELDDLITTVFGTVITAPYAGRHILTPLNVDVNEINEKCIDRVPGQVICLLSTDLFPFHRSPMLTSSFMN